MYVILETMHYTPILLTNDCSYFCIKSASLISFSDFRPCITVFAFSVAFLSLDTSVRSFLDCLFVRSKSPLSLGLVLFQHSYILRLHILSTLCATLRWKLVWIWGLFNIHAEDIPKISVRYFILTIYKSMEIEITNTRF